MKKLRDSNFELLRCILMFMVVLVHYNNSGMGNAFAYVEEGSINYYFLSFVESLAIIGTNGFVLLTGYFSWKKKSASLRKPIGLLIYVAAYNVLFYGINLVILQEPFSLRSLIFSFIPRNWYIVLYVVLMLLSPYINIMLQSLNKKSYLVLISIMFLLFSVWPTMLEVVSNNIGIATEGMHTIAINGSSNGYSIVNFVLLYIIGAGISKFNLFSTPKKLDILGYIVCSIMICIQQVLVGGGWSYANPIVIVSCICFFNIFRKLQLKSRCINTLSTASLGVFLLHTQYVICNKVWSMSGIESACKGNVLYLGIHMILVCAVTYLVCSFTDIGCRWITKSISKMLDKLPILTKNIVFIDEDKG